LACLTRFPWRQRNGNNGDTDTIEITVSDYFLRHKGIELRYSGNFPCIHAGRSKRPTYFPMEVCFNYILKASSLVKFHQLSEVLVNILYDQLCTLVPLQRYTKALSTLQRSSLVEKSRQKPQERMSTLNDVSCNLDFSLLQPCIIFCF
jgi:eukaryotic translation initiation factor 2C